jgi:hypothetical protein
MIHIGITAKLKDFEVPLFVGYFKIPKDQDLKATARAACKKYVENKHFTTFFSRLAEIEVYDRKTNEILLKIEI